MVPENLDGSSLTAGDWYSIHIAEEKQVSCPNRRPPKINGLCFAPPARHENCQKIRHAGAVFGQRLRRGSDSLSHFRALMMM